MIKEHFNYEENIMDSFRMFTGADKDIICPDADESVFMFRNPLYIPESDCLKSIYNSIVDNEQWTQWTNSSGKDDPPPDYYNDELQLMMDVMRVDDSAHIDESTGKLINPVRARESELIRELRDKGVLDAMLPDAHIIVTAKTALPADEDHYYTFYRDNFVRIIEKHKGSIPVYRQNHPGFKTIFFVYDESSM